MTGSLSTIAPKLAKLLPRLASDHDGEVVATVAAIRRALDGAGLDLHDLAASMQPGGRDPGSGDAAGSCDDLTAKFQFVWANNPPGDKWREILESIETQYRARGRISHKQLQLLNRFYETALRNVSRGCAA